MPSAVLDEDGASMTDRSSIAFMTLPSLSTGITFTMTVSPSITDMGCGSRASPLSSTTIAVTMGSGSLSLTVICSESSSMEFPA